MEQDLKAKIEQACQTAEEFTKLYYETLDKQRYLISRMYIETANLVWNGNGISGNDNIQKFYTDLPPSEHTIITLDAQPIIDSDATTQLLFLVKISGQVKYKNKIPKEINQTFVITAKDDKWKIVNDCFRTQELVNNDNGHNQCWDTDGVHITYVPTNRSWP